jgi:hypothetical protein
MLLIGNLIDTRAVRADSVEDHSRIRRNPQTIEGPRLRPYRCSLFIWSSFFAGQQITGMIIFSALRTLLRKESMSKKIHYVGINASRQITIDNDPDPNHQDPENRNNRNQIVWRADNTVKSFKIVFTSSPFRQGVLTITGDANGSTPDTYIDGNADGDFKYTVTAKPVSGSSPKPSDPHIIVSDMVPTDTETLTSIGSDMIDAVATVLAKHMNDVASGGARFFFPFGIQLITVEALGVTVTVSGETPPQTPAGRP